jgi:hypothetical protein
MHAIMHFVEQKLTISLNHWYDFYDGYIKSYRSDVSPMYVTQLKDQKRPSSDSVSNKKRYFGRS